MYTASMKKKIKIKLNKGLKGAISNYKKVEYDEFGNLCVMSKDDYVILYLSVYDRIYFEANKYYLDKHYDKVELENIKSLLQVYRECM